MTESETPGGAPSGFVDRRSSGFEDRRSSQRLGVELEVSGFLVAGGGSYLLKTMDISTGGLRFQSNRPISVGDQLFLYIPLVRHKKPFEVSGKVVWCSSPEGDSYIGGIMFTEVSPQAHQEITQFVSNTQLNQFLDGEQVDEAAEEGSE